MTHIQARQAGCTVQDSLRRNGGLSGELGSLNPLDPIHSTRMPGDSGVKRTMLKNEDTCGSGAFIIVVVESEVNGYGNDHFDTTAAHLEK